MNGQGLYIRPFRLCMEAQLHRFPPEVRARIVALGVDGRLWRAVDREWGDRTTGRVRVFLNAGRCDLEAGGGLSQVQVDDLWRLMKESQADLVTLSSRGHFLELPDTGHGVPLERPEAVADAVRNMIGFK